MIRFDYAPDVVARFPTIRHSIVEARDVTNRVAPRVLADEYHAEQNLAADRARTEPVAERPAIAAWRKVFRDFGTDPTQHRSAPEALLRRVDDAASAIEVLLGRHLDLGMVQRR